MFFKRYENSLLFYFKIIFCVFYIKNYLKKLKNIILIYFQPKNTFKKVIITSNEKIPQVSFDFKIIIIVFLNILKNKKYYFNIFLNKNILKNNL